VSRRHIVTFVYHDHDRTVIPLAVVRGQDHRWVLHAWQIDGTTARGETPPCWANSNLDEMTTTPFAIANGSARSPKSAVGKSSSRADDPVGFGFVPLLNHRQRNMGNRIC